MQRASNEENGHRDSSVPIEAPTEERVIESQVIQEKGAPANESVDFSEPFYQEQQPEDRKFFEEQMIKGGPLEEMQVDAVMQEFDEDANEDNSNFEPNDSSFHDDDQIPEDLINTSSVLDHSAAALQGLSDNGDKGKSKEKNKKKMGKVKRAKRGRPPGSKSKNPPKKPATPFRTQYAFITTPTIIRTVSGKGKKDERKGKMSSVLQSLGIKTSESYLNLKQKSKSNVSKDTETRAETNEADTVFTKPEGPSNSVNNAEDDFSSEDLPNPHEEENRAPKQYQESPADIPLYFNTFMTDAPGDAAMHPLVDMVPGTPEEKMTQRASKVNRLLLHYTRQFRRVRDRFRNKHMLFLQQQKQSEEKKALHFVPLVPANDDLLMLRYPYVKQLQQHDKTYESLLEENKGLIVCTTLSPKIFMHALIQHFETLFISRSRQRRTPKTTATSRTAP